MLVVNAADSDEFYGVELPGTGFDKTSAMGVLLSRRHLCPPHYLSFHNDCVLMMGWMAGRRSHGLVAWFTFELRLKPGFPVGVLGWTDLSGSLPLSHGSLVFVFLAFACK